MNDLYSRLGITKSATQEEVKKAYRSLAKKLHPDYNKNDETVADKFKEVSAAYAILGDENQRSLYDRGEIDENGIKRPRLDSEAVLAEALVAADMRDAPIVDKIEILALMTPKTFSRSSLAFLGNADPNKIKVKTLTKPQVVPKALI